MRIEQKEHQHLSFSSENCEGLGVNNGALPTLEGTPSKRPPPRSHSDMQFTSDRYSPSNPTVLIAPLVAKLNITKAEISNLNPGIESNASELHQREQTKTSEFSFQISPKTLASPTRTATVYYRAPPHANAVSPKRDENNPAVANLTTTLSSITSSPVNSLSISRDSGVFINSPTTPPSKDTSAATSATVIRSYLSTHATITVGELWEDDETDINQNDIILQLVEEREFELQSSKNTDNIEDVLLNELWTVSYVIDKFYYEIVFLNSIWEHLL